MSADSRMDKLDMLFLAVLSVVAAIAVLITMGCGGEGVSAPSPVSAPVQPVAVASAPVAVQPVAAVPVAPVQPWESVTSTWEGTTAHVVNLSDVPEWVSYCVYDLSNGWENQGLPIAQTKVDLGPKGEAWVTLESVLGRVGQACDPPVPSPSPTPSPAPSPTPYPQPSVIQVQLDVVHGACGVAPYGHGGHNYGGIVASVQGATRLVCPEGYELYQPKCVQAPCPAVCVPR